MDDKINKAIEVLKQGGIVVFPTDTAYGVGCRIDDEKAVERLLKLKRRPESQAVPVLVDSIEMAQRYLLPIPGEVLKLMQKYWPGGLTIVFPCKASLVPEKVRGKGQTLGVRWPDHLTVKNLIYGIGVPLLGPSANFHSEATPYKFSDLNPKFVSQVDLVLKEETFRQQPSTVIDCSLKPWKIIRQGAIRVDLGIMN
ncbi:MAG: L-threonylcarbamoyladenylate synthase [bacterium]|nr:L-threonylcarbamoyladenylate synthase [bacterium]